MKNGKITRVLQMLLIVVILILASIIGYDFYQGKKTRENVDDILKQLDDQIVINMSEQADNNNTDVQVGEGGIANTQAKGTATINNYVVYGKIEIPSVRIKYPILEYNSSTLKNSICNISGTPINGKGNLCIAGHNTSNGTLFGRLKKVKCGDTIEITNVYGKKYKYIVYSITAVQPEDNSLLVETEKPIVTLITCTNNAKQRLMVQGQLLTDN